MTQHIVRCATPADEQDIERFLAHHAPTSMFLRSNLAAHGLDGSTADTATKMIICIAEEQLIAVFGISNSGFLLAQNPHLVTPPAQLRQAWSGRQVLGMTGVAAQVTSVLETLGLQHAPMSLDRDEPLYHMDLAQLAGPFAYLRAPRPTDHEILCSWFTDYARDTGLLHDDVDAQVDAKKRSARAIEQAKLRIMEVDGVPVAMTDFNAQVADIVQVGGVFVPRNLRKNGYGRQVVAAHLAQARDRGINRAILFAANRAAARAYEAIGFRHIGAYRVALFEGDVSIPLAS
ncbi:GNAT family N-acetyltransferase [Tateyamaria sp.]|uniref:GNAT family N-acetyltransferase n=1 Tax=Tateyamaria sp. TaxID=1929288 RepID=UPI0032A10E8D